MKQLPALVALLLATFASAASVSARSSMTYASQFTFDKASNQFSKNATAPTMAELNGQWYLVGLAPASKPNRSVASNYDPSGLKTTSRKYWQRATFENGRVRLENNIGTDSRDRLPVYACRSRSNTPCLCFSENFNEYQCTRIGNGNLLCLVVWKPVADSPGSATAFREFRKAKMMYLR